MPKGDKLTNGVCWHPTLESSDWYHAAIPRTLYKVMANDVSWLLLGRDQCGHGERQRAAKPSDAAKLDAILGKVDD